MGTSEGDARAVRAFDFHLPKQFADGKAHRLIVVDDAGGDVGGGPVAFIAYADGLREAIAGLGLSEQEELRAQLLDRLLPMSVPFSDYRRCKERFPISYGPPVLVSGGVIMVGNGAIDDTLVSLNEQTHDQWVAASLPRTQDPMGWPAELAREFLSGEAAACDFIVFTLGGTVFEPSALHRIANAFVDFPQAKLVYADVDLAEPGRLDLAACLSSFRLRTDARARILRLSVRDALQYCSASSCCGRLRSLSLV